MNELTIDVSRRYVRPEIMDDPNLDSSLHLEALQGLRRLNSLSRSDAVLWPSIVKVAKANSGRPIRVLDLATGGGDIPIALDHRARRAGLSIEFDGCDISRRAVEYSNRFARKSNTRSCRFFQFDVLRDDIPKHYDIIMCSLFLHHLCGDKSRELMKKMADATRSIVLVNDLCRSRFGYTLAKTACFLLTRSSVVHNDGPLSVRAAYSIDEVESLAIEVGMGGAQVSRHWPQRFLLKWDRSDGR